MAIVSSPLLSIYEPIGTTALLSHRLRLWIATVLLFIEHFPNVVVLSSYRRRIFLPLNNIDIKY